MTDPLSDMITLLRPRTVFTKGISGAGAWGVRYTDFGHPSFCTVLGGSCRLQVDGQQPARLEAGDFVLLPATPGFVLSGFDPVTPEQLDPHVAALAAEEVRHGRAEGDPDVRLLGGYFIFDSPDADMLVRLMPPVVHMRGAERLSRLTQLVGEEASEHYPGRDLVLSRLVEVLLVEALRSLSTDDTPPGLLRGLADQRISSALRQMHCHPARPWTIAELAREAALSRSAFFDRFMRIIGTPPMEYLLGWRMALAKDLIRCDGLALSEVADRIGYGSASSFNTAFRRHVGQSPGQFARSKSI